MGSRTRRHEALRAPTCSEEPGQPSGGCTRRGKGAAGLPREEGLSVVPSLGFPSCSIHYASSCGKRSFTSPGAHPSGGGGRGVGVPPGCGIRARDSDTALLRVYLRPVAVPDELPERRYKCPHSSVPHSPRSRAVGRVCTISRKSSSGVWAALLSWGHPQEQLLHSCLRVLT